MSVACLTSRVSLRSLGGGLLRLSSPSTGGPGPRGGAAPGPLRRFFLPRGPPLFSFAEKPRGAPAASSTPPHRLGSPINDIPAAGCTTAAPAAGGEEVFGTSPFLRMPVRTPP